jgi:hypothetical protein
MYSVDRCFEIGLPDEIDPGPWVPLHHVDDLSFHVPDKQIVFFSPAFSDHVPGLININDFEHPGDAVYYFGSDEVHPEPIYYDHCVYIETPRQVSMWSHQAAMIALHDRWRRRVG